MEGDNKSEYRPIRIWLLVLSLAISGAYGAILFFTNWRILEYAGFRFAAIYNLFLVIAYFLLNFLEEKKPKEVLEIASFAFSINVFFIVDYFGGPTGFLFPILYLYLIAAFYYKRSYGYLALSAAIAYVLFYGFLQTQDATINPGQYILYLASFGVISLGGHFLNKRLNDIQKSNESLTKMTSKVTAEKAQDEAVLTAIADGVYAVDMDRNLVLLNKAGADLTGWEEKDALGLKCSAVMKLKNEEDVSVCEKDCPALQVWNTGEPVFRTDTCFVHKGTKKRIQLSSSYAPIKDFEGNMSGAICVFRDITKEKELERLRNEFVSTASHELRTPITATEGYLSIITDSGMVKIDDKGKEFIGKAKSTLLAMSKLIQNLLSVTKIEEGKLETNVTNFSIHDLAKEVVDVFAAKANEKGIKIELIESKDLTLKGKKVVGRSLNVRADMEMIREVLNNLIENAIKFTTKGGVSVSIDYDEEFATVNVEDTGMGMPKEGQKHLFEKFYRVDNTATREVGGTGLGLYITRSIVETFGGRIWVESAQGKGSKFHFTVPLALD
jgi:PAS domain S-box-containing protein